MNPADPPLHSNLPPLDRAPDLPPLWNGPDTQAVVVARAALMEVGRADLARLTHTNRVGMPSARHDDSDTGVLVRAFCLGHVAAGHDAKVVHHNGVPAIWCQKCYDRIEALSSTIGSPDE